MLNSVITEFQKLKRYSIILIGVIGVACSPIISIVIQHSIKHNAITFRIISSYLFFRLPFFLYVELEIVSVLGR